jgi:putative membrane protein
MDPTLALAATHHLLALAMAALLAAELAMLTADATRARMQALGRVDLAYGVAFAALVVVGLARVIWTEKGWDYYAASPAFWTKMATLALITALSLPPTIRYIRWGRAGRTPSPTEVAGTRRYLWAEAALFPLLGLAAAAMARGA